MEEKKEIIIVPDIHGRTFWKVARQYAKTSTVVFLGDYLDPYPREGIDMEDANYNFARIIELKEENWDNVHLLLGNHDLGYLEPSICRCRRDVERANSIRNIFLGISNYFDMEYGCSWNGRYVHCSHAGIHPLWENRHPPIYSIEDQWNYLFHQSVPDLTFAGEESMYYTDVFLESMSDISHLRGGVCDAGSMVWADIHEFVNVKPYPNCLQIVGHTQVKEPYWANEGIVCIDCRKVFRYDLENGVLSVVD